MKPPTPKPNVEPSPPGNDPHPSTEEVVRDEAWDSPRETNDRRIVELEEEGRVNNSVHDGKKYLKR